MMIKVQIPNVLTLSNLVCGALAIYFIALGRSDWASMLIILAALFDFADGFVARLLGVTGPLGKELDSLADLISFGLAPAFMAIHLSGAFGESTHWWQLAPLIMAPAAAYRLAKFNIDERQSDEFIGMPTPANALFWLSFALIATQSPPSNWLATIYSGFIESPILIACIALVSSLLMVSEIPLISLKFKDYSWKNNVWRWSLILLSAITLLILHYYALPIIIILYLLISIIQNNVNPKHGIHRRN